MGKQLLYLLVFVVCHASAKENLLKPKLQAHPLLAERIVSWIEQLEESPRNSTVWKNLVRIGEIANPYLFASLKSSTSAVRKQRIIEILRLMNNKSCADVLLRCLQNPNEDARVRAQAASTLGSMSPSSKILTVLGKCAMHRDVRIQNAAAYALCQFSTKAAIPHLIALLNHWDPQIKRKVYLKLLEITRRINPPQDYAHWHRWWLDYQDIFAEDQE